MKDVLSQHFFDQLPSLPVYKLTPHFGTKKYLGENFLEKLILYLRTFFQARYSYMKKITASLDVKFILVRTRVLKRVLATQV